VSAEKATITEYLVKDTAGAVVAVHVREDLPGGGKKFRWRLPDGTLGLGGRPVSSLPLYGSERLRDLAPDEPVVIVEGEKGASALVAAGIPAVGTVTGASGTPGDEALRPLLGRTVYLWPDADEPGRRHMDRIGAALLRLGHRDVRVIMWQGAPASGDAADLLSLEGAVDELHMLLDEARPFKAAEAPGAQLIVASRRQLFAPLATLLANPTPRRWLVKDLVEWPSTLLIFGPSGSGKSFVGVDLAAATACGGEWMAKAVTPGPVYYVAGEGHRGLLRRFQAWQTRHGTTIPEHRLFLSTVPIELSIPGAAEVEAEIFRRTQETGEAPALIVIDTLARALPADADENTAKDMMGFIKAADGLKERFGCVVAVIHHSGVADDKRARGSTALKAAVDAELCITKRGGIRTAEWTKLKDLPEEPHPQEFIFVSELLGMDEDGALITSAVVEWRGAATSKAPAALTPTEELGLETLKTACAGTGTASLDEWRRVFYLKHWGDDAEAKRKAFLRVRSSLVKKGVIDIVGDLYSIPHKRKEG